MLRLSFHGETSMSDAKTASAAETDQNRTFERRRAPLPQPDFTPYKDANAYPGQNFFFVGHSYDVDLDGTDGKAWQQRSQAISALFTKEAQWLPVQQALTNESFNGILTRFEQDLLHRLPESALIGTAIDAHGKLISQSFTIWREERRRQRSE